MGLFEEIHVSGWPNFRLIQQRFPRPVQADIAGCIRNQMHISGALSGVKQGDVIAVTAGSRSIHGIDVIIKTVLAELKKAGTKPYVIAAMGSHGGASVRGQKDILDSLGITEENMGAKIVYDVEWEQIGSTESGMPVFFSKEAIKADGIIVINRVKMHTNFRGKSESGLLKMLAIGMGKHKGALTLHARGFDCFSENVIAASRVILGKVNVLLGVGIVENAYGETALVEVIHRDCLIEEDGRLLTIANENLPRIPFKNIDILVVCEMGKDISGDGMDPNIIGRYSSDLKPDYTKVPKIGRIVALDLTEQSHGSAVGVGYADVITSRLHDKIDMMVSCTNAVTATAPQSVKIPIVMPNDRHALEVAYRVSARSSMENIRICIIKNTLKLQQMLITESLMAELCPDAKIETLERNVPLCFDAEENIHIFEKTEV